MKKYKESNSTKWKCELERETRKRMKYKICKLPLNAGLSKANSCLAFSGSSSGINFGSEKRRENKIELVFFHFVIHIVLLSVNESFYHMMMKNKTEKIPKFSLDHRTTPKNISYIVLFFLNMFFNTLCFLFFHVPS
jgi:hypothetical protein